MKVVNCNRFELDQLEDLLKKPMTTWLDCHPWKERSYSVRKEHLAIIRNIMTERGISSAFALEVARKYVRSTIENSLDLTTKDFVKMCVILSEIYIPKGDEVTPEQLQELAALAKAKESSLGRELDRIYGCFNEPYASLKQSQFDFIKNSILASIKLIENN